MWDVRALRFTWSSLLASYEEKLRPREVGIYQKKQLSLDSQNDGARITLSVLEPD